VGQNRDKIAYDIDRPDNCLRFHLPETGSGTWRDEAFAGLELIGKKAGASWYIRFRVDGKRLRQKLGRWPMLDHVAAKDTARKWIATAAARQAVGGDVLEERENRRRKAKQRRDSPTVAEALSIYSEAHLAGLRTGQQTQAVIRNPFASILKTRLDTLDRQTVVRCIE
jgi:hypothetical protein